MSKTLLVRMDRIGDLVLTLPVDAAFPPEEVHWFINEGLGFVAELADPRRSFDEFPKAFSWRHFRAMLKRLRELKLKEAVVFHAPWWVSLALFFARVPIRCGRRSQWHSYLFFNKGLRQRRSLSERHESEYNWQLVQYLQDQREPLPKPLQFRKPDNNDLLAHFDLIPQGYYVVHPGMGGSALNWPTSHYLELIKKLMVSAPVVITGTAADALYLQPLKEALAMQTQVLFLDKKLSGPELVNILSQAKAVVAPSTGVVHLSASTGVPTVGLYSLVPAERARRWGPRGQRVKALEPVASSNDMDLGGIPVVTVLAAIDELFGSSPNGHNVVLT